MDAVAYGLTALGFAAVPATWIVLFLRRRRSRVLADHDTTPPISIVTTGQRR